MSKRTGTIVTMTLVAAVLAGFGYWQFAGVSLTGGEDEEHENEAEHAEYSRSGLDSAGAVSLARRLAEQ